MDLRAIETEVSAVGPVEVTSDQFDGKAETIEEFVQSGARSLDSLDFRAYRQKLRIGDHVWVSIDGDRAYLGGDTNDHQVAGVLSKVEQIMRVRQRTFAEHCSSSAPWIIGPSFSLLASAALLTSGQREKLPVAVWAVAAAVLAAGVAAALVGRFAHGGILLESRESTPSWFRRNRDEIVVQLAVALFVLAIGYVLGRSA
jgi:hypothetical protein